MSCEVRIEPTRIGPFRFALWVDFGGSGARAARSPAAPSTPKSPVPELACQAAAPGISGAAGAESAGAICFGITRGATIFAKANFRGLLVGDDFVVSGGLGGFATGGRGARSILFSCAFGNVCVYRNEAATHNTIAPVCAANEASIVNGWRVCCWRTSTKV